jgi:predicted metal-dependent peptidase
MDQPIPGRNLDEIERKLSAARTQLIIDKPFLGALVLRLPITVGSPTWCKSIAVDARALYYNRDFIARLSLDETKFMLAHEALHCALAHFNRRQHRAKRRWDLACDYAINVLLVADGLVAPAGAPLNAKFHGMTAEQIYPCLQEIPDAQSLDDHIYEDDAGSTEGAHGGGGDPDGAPPDDGKPPTGAGAPAAGDSAAGGAPRPVPARETEREQLATQWQLRLAGAAQEAKRAGKLSDSMARLVGDLLQPQLPWRMLLARYLSAAARTDYSFSRPTRREGSAILPGLRAAYVDVVVIIDTSGSIAAKEMNEFVSELNALKGSVNARVTLHACDALLAADGPWTFEPWEELRLPKEFSGGGATKFTPAFDWAARLDRQPDLLLYFTDARGEFPEHEPAFPVLWLVKGKGAVPWGQRVQLN